MKPTKKSKDPKYYFSQKPFAQYVNRQSGICFTCFTLTTQQTFRGCADSFHIFSYSIITTISEKDSQMKL